MKIKSVDLKKIILKESKKILSEQNKISSKYGYDGIDALEAFKKRIEKMWSHVNDEYYEDNWEDSKDEQALENDSMLAADEHCKQFLKDAFDAVAEHFGWHDLIYNK